VEAVEAVTAVVEATAVLNHVAATAEAEVATEEVVVAAMVVEAATAVVVAETVMVVLAVVALTEELKAIQTVVTPTALLPEEVEATVVVNHEAATVGLVEVEVNVIRQIQCLLVDSGKQASMTLSRFSFKTTCNPLASEFSQTKLANQKELPL